MRTRTTFLVAAGLTATLTACGVPIRTGTSSAPSVPSPDALTFAWNQESDRVMGDSRLENNRFFEDRLHEAVEWELSLRGIRRVDSGANLMAHHHLSLEDHEDVVETIDEAGYTTTEAYSYEGGTVVIHLVDVRSGETFWLSWGQANIEPALAGPESMRTWVYDLVRAMFERWPVPARGGED